MFCVHCGQQIPDGSVFCPKCGEKQPVANAQQMQPQFNVGVSQGTQGYQDNTASVGYHATTITVSDKEQFTAAVKGKYDTIIVEGPFADEISKKLGNASKGNVASNIAIAAGFIFWPALIGGVAGKLLTKDLKKYEVSSVEANCVIVTKKR